MNSKDSTSADDPELELWLRLVAEDRAESAPLPEPAPEDRR
jgi:hypothetical protein